MSNGFRVYPRVACSWPVRLASLVVRKDLRASWFAPRQANLQSLWILMERGELAGSRTHLAWLWREAFANAFLTRCRAFDLRRWMRGPAFPIAAAAATLLFVAVGTHGFAATRSLLDALRNVDSPANQNRVIGNFFPILFAVAASLIAAAGRISLRHHSRHYLTFFVFKTLSLVTIALLLWVEGGAALRHSIPNQTLRALAGCLLPAVVFVASVTWAVLWSLADQQHRCSVCLRRLVLPVRIGSCASVFEPATVEWLCEEGHGALWEHDTGVPESWIELERVGFGR